MITDNERKELRAIKLQLLSLKSYLQNLDIDENSNIVDWYKCMNEIKRIQGNLNNRISFIACLLAKSYLIEKFGINDFDATTKKQGAKGLDIDITVNNKRVIAEIKTTHPYLEEKISLGSNQKQSFMKDFKKLIETPADFKFFFLTDKMTYEIVIKQYKDLIPGVVVELLEIIY